LYKAVRHSDTIQVRRLLSEGSDPNETSGLTGTILDVAAARGHTPILRLLLEARRQPHPLFRLPPLAITRRLYDFCWPPGHPWMLEVVRLRC
jgi:ankyrin repeat protein